MNLKRSIPSVSILLNHPEIKQLIELHSRENTVNTIREILTLLREEERLPDTSEIIASVKLKLEEYQTIRLSRVINATGTLVHTNLGRSVTGDTVIKAITDHLPGYCDLEYDLKNGNRGRRGAGAEEKLIHLSGAEKALVVNNNAAAVLLAVNTFAMGTEVIVSRGELIEIGGSFRLHEVIERAGGILKEVGTTNKTRVSDYEKAVNKNTGLILKMHTSNYKITGFVEETGLDDLVRLGSKKKVPVMHDVGSGLFVDADKWHFDNEPDPRTSLKSGADVVSMSGDKILGGPQAGIILGKKKAVDLMAKNPMMRALRPGKITFIALEAALIPFINTHRIKDDIPLFSALGMDIKALKKRADRLARIIRKAKPGINVSVESAEGSIGGGAMPGLKIQSYAVLLSHPSHSPSTLAAIFRKLPVPVIGTFSRNRFALNVLSLLDGEEKILKEIIGNLGI